MIRTGVLMKKDLKFETFLSESKNLAYVYNCLNTNNIGMSLLSLLTSNKVSGLRHGSQFIPLYKYCFKIFLLALTQKHKVCTEWYANNVISLFKILHLRFQNMSNFYIEEFSKGNCALATSFWYCSQSDTDIQGYFESEN